MAEDDDVEDFGGAVEEAKAKEVTLDPMKFPTMPCKYGREAHVHPETGQPLKHRIGKEHPTFPGMGKSKRRGKWCPEVA
jgi:hypothetical protein